MSSHQFDWRTDWTAFVRAFAADFDRGLSNEQVSRSYEGEHVTWTGILEEKDFDSNLKGVELRFPKLEIRLADGRWATIQSLYMSIHKSTVSSWQAVALGATVRISPSIWKSQVHRDIETFTERLRVVDQSARRYAKIRQGIRATREAVLEAAQDRGIKSIRR